MSSPNVRVNSATAPTSPSWSSAVGRRSRTMRLSSTTTLSTSSATRSSSADDGDDGSMPGVRASWPMAVRNPSDTPVRAGPSPSWRSRRNRRRSSSRADTIARLDRRRSAARRTQPTARLERSDQLVEDLPVALAQGRAVDPSDDEPADDLAPMAQVELAVVGRQRTAGRRALPSAGHAQVDGHGVEAQLVLQAGGERRQQAVTWVGAQLVDDALHDGEGIVARAVDETVDQPAEVVAGGLEGEGDGSGGGDEEPRRSAAPEHPAEAGDDGGVEDDDPAGEDRPLDDAPGHTVDACLGVAAGR